jgi:hypothetical protein
MSGGNVASTIARHAGDRTPALAPEFPGRDGFSSSRQPAPRFRMSMILSENRCTLFGIML